MYLCVVFVVHQHVPDTPCTPIAHPNVYIYRSPYYYGIFCELFLPFYGFHFISFGTVLFSFSIFLFLLYLICFIWDRTTKPKLSLNFQQWQLILTLFPHFPSVF